MKTTRANNTNTKKLEERIEIIRGNAAATSHKGKLMITTRANAAATSHKGEANDNNKG